MNVLVNSITDTIKKIGDYAIGCYVIEVDDIDDKLVHKGYWRELRDKGQPIWQEKSGLLVPSKGFVISDQVKIKFRQHPNMWSLDEVIKEKYDKKLKKHGTDNVYYQEFIEFNKIEFDGQLNFGKKFCSGSGVLVHDLEKNIKEFVIEIEANVLPKMFVSYDNQSWCNVDSLCFEHRFKKETRKFYLKIDDHNNVLRAYSIYW